MSSFKENIENLFVEEEEAPKPQQSQFEQFDLFENPDADLPAGSVDLSDAKKQIEEAKREIRLASEVEVDPAQLRQFRRADVSDQKIELKFSDRLQFAKHYVENISLGGMFVKTKEKYKMGEVIPLWFSLPPTDDRPEQPFELMAEVVRVAPNGVGLKFTNLNGENQKFIEEYVRSVLPKDQGVRQNVKQSTLEKLQARREIEAENKQKQSRRWKYGSLALVLLALNAYLAIEVVDVKQPDYSNQTSHANFKVGDAAIKMNEIKAIRLDQDGQVSIDYGQSKSITVPKTTQLPYQLRESIKLIKAYPKAKPKRKSKNTNLTRQRPR